MFKFSACLCFAELGKGKKSSSKAAAAIKPADVDAMIAESSVLVSSEEESASVIVDYSEPLAKDVEATPAAQAVLAWLGDNVTRAAFSKDWKSRYGRQHGPSHESHGALAAIECIVL